MRHGKYPFILAFLLPPVALYAIFVISPYIQAFYISLTEWSGFTSQATFIGLDNYQWLLRNEYFWAALWHNVLLLIALPLITIGLGLFFASMLNVGGRRGTMQITGVRGSSVYKVLYFLPQVLSVAIIGVLWRYAFEPSTGLVNGVLRAVGLDALTRAWLGDPSVAFWCVLAVLVWANVGFYVVLFSAGMQAIPRDIYEAALLDGASRFATFWRITVPLISPTILLTSIITVIGSLQVFAQIAVLTQGGPGTSTTVLVYYLYQQAFQFHHFGYGATLSILLFVIVLALTVLQWQMRKRWVFHES